MILLDTNVISALMQTKPDPVVEAWMNLQPRDTVWTTSITVFEIEYGLERLSNGRRKEGLLRSWQDVIEIGLAGRIAGFDQSAARAAARLSACREKSGLVIDIRDTQIAGIAIALRATIATRNQRHFNDLDTPVIDPWDMMT